jgi:hypothetical protein
VFDYFGDPTVSIQVTVSGTVTWTVQQTLDNVNDTSITPTWFSHPDTNLVSQTGSRQGNYAYVPAAVRLNVSAGDGTATMTVIQSGAPGD